MAQTAPPPTPATFNTAKKQRALEAQKSMVVALKAEKYKEALEHARTALALDATNVMVQQFLTLLEEKVSLDEDSGSEDEGAEQQGTAGEYEEQGSSDDSDDDSDDDDDDEDDEADSDEEEGDEDGVGTSAAAAAAAAAADLQTLSLDPKCSTLQKSKRSTLRSSLAASIKDLKLAEHARQLAGSDPLLQ